MARPSGGFRFVSAPPKRSMRKRSPESAPRLYEWLVDNGYAEPVSSTSRARRGRAKRAKNSRSRGRSRSRR